MKVRKLAVALALAGGLGSGVAQALGLGEIELQSYLNEPLDAEINLRKSEGVSPDDVIVNIAPQSAYERVGIDRSFFLTKLDFEVTTAPDGSLVVNVSSREPLREPYLNFLIEVNWPNGRLMREYAVLVDPPVYAEESGVDEQVSAPATTQAREPQSEQQTRQQDRTQTTSSQGQSSGTRTLGPTNSSDTLWNIAAQVRPNNNVSMQQVMLAIQELNPDAFINGNINRLKRGEVLRVPDEDQIRSRSRGDANREVAAQNEAFSSPQRTVDATGEDADGPSGETSGSTGGDQLRLMAADESDSAESSDSGSAGGDGDADDGVDTGSAVAMEELESARRENDELTGRVDDLQDQVETLQRLLELKNTQLAEMQGSQTDSGDPTAESAEEGEGQDSASEDPDAEAMGEDASADANQDMAADSEGESDQMGVAEPADEQGEAAEGGEPLADGEESSADGEEPSADAQEPSADAQELSEGAEEPSAEAEAPEETSEPEAVPAEPEESSPAQKPFPDNIIDAISNNFIYQVALGGGLIVLLLLLLLLARRNANREKAFYDELNSDSGADETDSFDLTFDEDEDSSVPEGDAIAEADAYIAYGRNDQAAHTLETAISREPSRTDLRLKLLGVYAEIQDRESFDKQFREIEALDDDAATAEAQNLQNRLEEAESMPSIDDLESQLRSGGSQPEESSSYDSNYDSNYDIDSYDDAAAPDTALSDDALAEADDLESETDFEDLDLDLPGEDDDTGEKAGDDRDDLIEYDLSGIEADDEASELDETGKSDLTEEKDEAFDYTLEDDDLEDGDLEEGDLEEDDLEDDDLSLDFEESDLEEDDKPAPVTDAEDSQPASEKDGSEAVDDLEIDGDGELDESFLDELDAELDKVAGEEDSAEESGESELDDLELDVSDEDLALMEEFSESDEASPADARESAEDDELSLDDELGLEDTLKGEEPSDPEQEVEGAEQADEMLSEGGPVDAQDEDDLDAVVPPVASDKSSASDSDRDIDESDLGDDDDFDFLAGTDEAATKLDLARAYVEMGDVDGARDILEEVALEGSEEQKAEAQDLLKNLS